MDPIGSGVRRGRFRGHGGGQAAPQWRKRESPAIDGIGPEVDGAEQPEEVPRAQEPKLPRPPRRRPPPRPAAASGSESPVAGAVLPVGAEPYLEGEPHALGASAAATRSAASEDRGARVRLAQQLKVAEQQAAQRSAAVARLREDARKLEAEAALALQSEARHLSEASSLLAHSSSSEEAFRGRQFELLQRISESECQEAERRAKEREWREELDSMAHQQGTLAEEVADLERDGGRWRKAAAEQAERLANAEKRLKQLEAQRADCRAQGTELQQLTERHKATAAREEATVRELRGHIESVRGGSSRQALLLQAVIVALWLLVLWLLLAD